MKRNSPETESTKFRSCTMKTEASVCCDNKNVGTERLLRKAREVEPQQSSYNDNDSCLPGQPSVENIVDRVGRPTIALPTTSSLVSSPISSGPYGKKMRIAHGSTPASTPCDSARATRPSRIGKPALLGSPSRRNSPGSVMQSAKLLSPLSVSFHGESREMDSVARQLSSDWRSSDVDHRTTPPLFGSEHEMDNSSPLSISSSSSSSNWAVANESLPAVPIYYPLSPTSCFVEGADALVVSRRISECLRDQSIAAIYVNESATARATTQDHVAFTIRLFSSNKEEQGSEGILVEIQHGHGSPMTFHRACRVIFNAAKGKPTLPSPPSSPTRLSSSPSRFSSSPSPTIKMQQQQGEEQQQQESIVLALEKALELLHKDRMDANKLGMELLVFLTDASQVREKDALFASNVILFGEHNKGGGRSSASAAIHEKVVSSIVQEEEEDAHEEEDAVRCEDGEASSMRSIGLVVLRNALRTVAQHHHQAQRRPNEEARFLPATTTRESHPHAQQQPLPIMLVDEKVANSLLGTLKEATYQPHEACLAASCISSMMQMSNNNAGSSSSMGAFIVALEQAHQHGLSAHAMLAWESKHALSVLRMHAASMEVSSCA